MKTYRINPQIGHARNSVSFHDGASTHKDGSPFWDIAIFNRRRDRDRYVRELKKEGYTEA